MVTFKPSLDQQADRQTFVLGGCTSKKRAINQEKYGHVFRGWSSLSKIICFVGIWTVFQFWNGLNNNPPIIIFCSISIIDKNFLINRFGTFKLLRRNVKILLKGGSEPNISVQTFCVHSSIGGGGVIGVFANVKVWIFF